jgi:hypothetical protein
VFSNIPGVDVEDGDIEKARESIYGDQIGLMLDTEDDDYSYAMSLDKSGIWVDDPKREFLGTRKYTVLGRIEEVIPPNSEWDYIDLLRVAGTVLSEDSVQSVREIANQFVDIIDGFEQEIELPDLNDVSMQDLQGQSSAPTKQSTLSIDIADKKISVDGKAIIIQPIAIYW